MNHFLALLGSVNRSLLVVCLLTGTAFVYAGTVIATLSSLYGEARAILDDVEKVLDHPAIRPLA